MITPEEEDKLHNQKVMDLLEKITDLKTQAMEEQSHFYVANTLGRCHEIIQNMHIENGELRRSNAGLADNRRWYFAGLAMQALITSDGIMGDTTQQAFLIADNMVNYVKQDSKAKCTDDGTGTTTTKNSNNV